MFFSKLLKVLFVVSVFLFGVFFTGCDSPTNPSDLSNPESIPKPSSTPILDANGREMYYSGSGVWIAVLHMEPEVNTTLPDTHCVGAPPFRVRLVIETYVAPGVFEVKPYKIYVRFIAPISAIPGIHYVHYKGAPYFIEGGEVGKVSRFALNELMRLDRGTWYAIVQGMEVVLVETWRGTDWPAVSSEFPINWRIYSPCYLATGGWYIK